MKTYIAMLRGINVGGKHKIKMEALEKIFNDFGYNNVQSYIQSGNVFFDSDEINKKKLENNLKNKIFYLFGYDVPVIIKDAFGLKKIIRNNPFLKNKEIDPAHFHVTFLSAIPTIELVQRIPKRTINNEECEIIKDIIYSYCPNGYGVAKMNNMYFESKLKIIATTRNWKTCNELLKIVDNNK